MPPRIAGSTKIGRVTFHLDTALARPSDMPQGAAIKIRAPELNVFTMPDSALRDKVARHVELNKESLPKDFLDLFERSKTDLATVNGKPWSTLTFKKWRWLNIVLIPDDFLTVARWEKSRQYLLMGDFLPEPLVEYHPPRKNEWIKERIAMGVDAPTAMEAYKVAKKEYRRRRLRKRYRILMFVSNYNRYRRMEEIDQLRRTRGQMLTALSSHLINAGKVEAYDAAMVALAAADEREKKHSHEMHSAHDVILHLTLSKRAAEADAKKKTIAPLFSPGLADPWLPTQPSGAGVRRFNPFGAISGELVIPSLFLLIGGAITFAGVVMYAMNGGYQVFLGGIGMMLVGGILHWFTKRRITMVRQITGARPPPQQPPQGAENAQR